MRFLLFSLAIHAGLAAVLAVSLAGASKAKTLATLDLTRVTFSFAEVERETAAPDVSSTASRQSSLDRATVPNLERPVPEDNGVLPPEPPEPELKAVVEPAVAVEQFETPAPRQARIDAPPQSRQPIKPVYPKAARQRGAEGDVILEFAIGLDGVVEAVKIISSSGSSDLDDAAVKAVKSALFNPARIDDRPVASLARLTLAFRLKSKVK